MAGCGNTYGKNYDPASMREAKNHVTDLLEEDHPDSKQRSVRRDLRHKQKEVQQHELPQRKKSRDLER